MIKIPVIDNNNKNYTLAYPFEKELLPPEYLQKHNFREIFTSIPLNDSQLNWKVEGVKTNNVIKAEQITGQWVNAQEWINHEYPRARTSVIRRLDLKNKGLVGSLDLTQFIDLEEVDCSGNYLSWIKTPSTTKKILASSNCIKSVNGLEINWNNLDSLDLEGNPLDIQEFTTMFIELKVLVANHQAEVDKDERITNYKNQLKNLADQLASAEMSNKTWQEKYQLLKEEVDNYRQERARLEQELKESKTNWWQEHQTPIIVVTVLSAGGLGIYLVKKYIF